jgi:hypothetical protein
MKVAWSGLSRSWRERGWSTAGSASASPAPAGLPWNRGVRRRAVERLDEANVAGPDEEHGRVAEIRGELLHALLQSADSLQATVEEPRREVGGS